MLRCGDNAQGHVINISSIAAADHYAGGSIYCGTKAFVTAFTDSLRHDLVGTNIRCELLDCLTPISSLRQASAEYSGLHLVDAPTQMSCCRLVTCSCDTPSRRTASGGCGDFVRCQPVQYRDCCAG